MPITVSIFDFDQTTTIKHSFQQFQQRHYSGEEAASVSYSDGELNARTNTKINITEYLQHNRDHLSAIATYHNNPAFIAGFIATLLKKKLTYVQTRNLIDDPMIAVDYYSVEDTDRPFLISYISASSTEFENVICRLKGKNEQITFLRECFLNANLIKQNTMINYYDDSLPNFKKAQTLSSINAHLIAATNECFTIIDTFYCVLPPDAFAEKDQSADEFSTDEEEEPTEEEPTKEEPTVVTQAKPAPLPPQPISANFFMQIMDSPAAKIAGLPLAIAGIAAMTAGTLAFGNVIPDFSGLEASGAMIVGAAISVLGARMSLGYSFFSPEKKPAEQHTQESKTQLQPI